MVHETVSLREELRKWLPIFRATLGVSQNEFARRAGIDESIFSRWLNGKVTSHPAEVAAGRTLERLKRRVPDVSRARAS